MLEGHAPRLLAALGLAVALAGGCAAETPPTPPPPDLVAGLPVYRAPREPDGRRAARPAPPAPRLSEGDALVRAMARSPHLEQLAWALREREGHSLQAGRPPNPEIETELEDVAGTGALEGFGAAELTVALSQRIELGGKRAARRASAASEQQLAAWDHEIERLALFTRVRRAFVELLGRQLLLETADELLGTARSLEAAVAARVEAGDASPVETTRASVAVAAARLEERRAKADVAAARTALSTLWGESEARFERADGRLERPTPVPPLRALLPLVERHPSVARAAAERTRRRLALEAADASAVPDLTLTAGVRHFEELGDQALLVGFGLPLPLFDRNQGERRALRYALEGGRAAEREAIVAARAGLRTAHLALETAHAEAEALSEEILPAARAALDATREGYHGGKFGYLDVLDAQRTLSEAKRAAVEALTTYHHARAEVEHWIARALPEETMP